MRDFVHGWFDGIEMIKNDPAASYAVVGKALKLDNETVSGMLSGLKLTPYADNAQFYGLSGGKAHYETLFDTAFVIWRKKGLVTRPVDAKDWADTRFLAALASGLSRADRSRRRSCRRKAPSAQDRAIINKQIQIHFTPGSDEIMAGSYFVLDALGETMTSFGGTYLRVEGNTDSTGSATGEHDALRAPRAGGEELHPEELPEHPGGALPDDRPRLGEPGRPERPPKPAGSSTAAPTSRWSSRSSRDAALRDGPRRAPTSSRSGRRCRVRRRWRSAS